MALQELVNEILEFDSRKELQDSNLPTIRNLLFFSNALAGETGEVANDVKKILRDGPSTKLLEELREELIDVLIYVFKLAILTNTNLDAEWKDKMKILEKRWEKRIEGYWHTKKDVDERIFLS